MLDVKVFEPTRVLDQPPVVVIERDDRGVTNILETFPETREREITYQFRYVVHRQHVGFFTPVVFDIKFSYLEYQGDTDVNTLNILNRLAEPFIEGALFMNHASPFIFNMLKGQEAGFDRKVLVGRIDDSVRDTNNIWYSDWETPPITQQHQRIMVYDLSVFGSVLDPINAVKQIARLVEERRKRTPTITSAKIVGGYTQKTL